MRVAFLRMMIFMIGIVLVVACVPEKAAGPKTDNRSQFQSPLQPAFAADTAIPSPLSTPSVTEIWATAMAEATRHTPTLTPDPCSAVTLPPTTISTVGPRQVSTAYPTPTATLISRVPAGLVYTIGAGSGLWLIGANGQPRQLATAGYKAVLSPDQQQLLYVRDYEGDIWLRDIATQNKRNLTKTPDKIEEDYQWWPAHPGLIVFKYRPADSIGWAGYLAAVNTDGTAYRVLDGKIGSGSLPALSPDGQTIAYERGGEPWLYRLSTGPEPISKDSFGIEFNGVSSPAWSPDGRLLAWKVYGPQECQDGWSGVVILDLSQRKGHLLHRYTLLGGSEATGLLKWSPDGRWIAVENIAEFAGAKVSLWIMRTDGSEEHQLGSAESPVWSPDGRQVMVWGWPPNATSYLDAQVQLVDTARWQPRQLDLPAGAQVVDWVTVNP